MKRSALLADELNEFRYLPMPIGGIVNDLVEQLDTISMFPTLPRLYKMMEDIPFLKKFERNLRTREIYYC